MRELLLVLCATSFAYAACSFGRASRPEAGTGRLLALGLANVGYAAALFGVLAHAAGALTRLGWAYFPGRKFQRWSLP